MYRQFGFSGCFFLILFELQPFQKGHLDRLQLKLVFFESLICLELQHEVIHLHYLFLQFGMVSCNCQGKKVRVYRLVIVLDHLSNKRLLLYLSMNKKGKSVCLKVFEIRSDNEVPTVL